MDVNGNDNQPEWGYCTAPGCDEAAFPIWLSGEYPDDPDLLLCETHIGAEIARLHALAADLSRQIGEQNTTIGYQDAMLTEMRTTLDAAYHGLMSYACGNSATALAEEMAAHILATIEKVNKQ